MSTADPSPAALAGESSIRSNLVVLWGTIVGDPQCRELVSGSVVVHFDVRTPTADGPAAVPVSWPDPPPADAALLCPGLAVVAIGVVRRRFFRVGGATQSRTEVVAERVIPQRRAKTAHAAISVALASLRS